MEKEGFLVQLDYTARPSASVAFLKQLLSEAAYGIKGASSDAASEGIVVKSLLDMRPHQPAPHRLYGAIRESRGDNFAEFGIFKYEPDAFGGGVFAIIESAVQLPKVPRVIVLIFQLGAAIAVPPATDEVPLIYL